MQFKAKAEFNDIPPGGFCLEVGMPGQSSAPGSLRRLEPVPWPIPDGWVGEGHTGTYHNLLIDGQPILGDVLNTLLLQTDHHVARIEGLDYGHRQLSERAEYLEEAVHSETDTMPSVTKIAPWAESTIGWPQVSARKYANGMVNLTGSVSKVGGEQADQHAFTLPEGFRPRSQLMDVVPTGNGPQRCDVMTNGDVLVQNVPSGRWASFNITFWTR